MPSVQLLVPCLSTWSFPEPSVASSGPISAIVSEPWFSLLASEWFSSLQLASVQIYRASVAFSVSLALFQSRIQILVWFVLEVGPAFGRGLDSVHPRERPQPQLRSRLQYHHWSPRQYLRSLRDLDAIRHGWDLGPHHQCPREELGGPGPPSGPAHRA